MKHWVKILLLTGITALLCVITQDRSAASYAQPQEQHGEFKAQASPGPVTDDYGSVFNAPAQIPAITPNQSSRLVTTAKYRTTLMRTNILRRNANRLSANLYTPIAATGCLVVERMSSPMRHTRAVHFYVLELCRLLC